MVVVVVGSQGTIVVEDAPVRVTVTVVVVVPATDMVVDGVEVMRVVVVAVLVVVLVAVATTKTNESDNVSVAVSSTPYSNAIVAVPGKMSVLGMLHTSGPS